MLKYPILRFKSHYITVEILFQRYKCDWANGSRYHKYICGGWNFIANNKLDNYTIIPCVCTHSLLTSCISKFSITGAGPPPDGLVVLNIKVSSIYRVFKS